MMDSGNSCILHDFSAWPRNEIAKKYRKNNFHDFLWFRSIANIHKSLLLNFCEVWGSLKVLEKLHKSYHLYFGFTKKSFRFEHFIKDFLHFLVKYLDFRAPSRSRNSTPRWSWVTFEHTRSIYSLWKRVFWALKVQTPNLESLNRSLKLVKFDKIRSAPPYLECSNRPGSARNGFGARSKS